MLLSALSNPGWDVSLPLFPQPGMALACLPQEVWRGWVPSCSAKGVAQAKRCVSRVRIIICRRHPAAAASQPPLKPGGLILPLQTASLVINPISGRSRF